MLRAPAIVLLGFVLAASSWALAQRAATPTPAANAHADATARIVGAAGALLALLGDAERAKVQFSFDGPQKTRWSNLPTGIFSRQGLRMGDLTPAQRSAVMRLMATALSADGYRKVTEIIRGDETVDVAVRWASPCHQPDALWE